MALEGLQMPRLLDIDKESLTDTYGKFALQPLERGFGVTIGHGLRRVLVSQIQGAAIKSLSVEGVQHEFSVIKGVREDVPEIVLNLKEVALRFHGDEDRVLRVEAKGPGELKAKDLAVDASVEIMNPELHIGTLGKDANVVMELTVGNGRGYVFADENKSAEQPIGTIPMDSNFSPILKVNYNIENARVGRRTDYDKLTLEVWTDGSVGPEDAVAQAARVLIEHLGLIANLEDEPAQGSDEKEVDEETKRVARLLNTNVDELELTVRSANCLRAAGISTLKEMVQRTEAEMLKFRNFGRKSLKELGEILTTMDLAWGMDISRYEDVEVEEEPAGSLAEEF
ncbi:MAG TPA: DNA-directed RNA polymerase subunit alpha [Candidatus Latescibacteria bacterium]|jgi:DNA-directed RNA polymerase subunit alpha|nr:DNA-directed RNA polymerase subunit alpha [Gemmatimonadaceae bacterium]MDP7632142.1 DNA-directed RNA polymerase subunit alpha [Candidatus Latescibacterota bacterium]HJP30327.1 DNA-directed RNA polymerase subunit alpha [Candidatus Latescibacterota bacterium]|tara:strand:+ start:1517 stop:2536 length:1020 start_codon:yes stop_codon:yes gene_type:complete